MSKILGVHTSPGLKIGYIATGGTAFGMSAGDLHFVKCFAMEDGTLYTLSAFKAAQSAGIKSVMGIYSDVAGSPSALLGQTTEFTNTLGAFGSTVGGQCLHPLQSPVAIVKGQTYWLAYIQNTTANMENGFNSNTNGIFIHKASFGYTTTLPATVTAPFTNPSGGLSVLAGW